MDAPQLHISFVKKTSEGMQILCCRHSNGALKKKKTALPPILKVLFQTDNCSCSNQLFHPKNVARLQGKTWDKPHPPVPRGKPGSNAEGSWGILDSYINRREYRI